MENFPQSPWAPLVGNVSVVTGASGGLGSQMVRRLLEVGAYVVASDVDGVGLKQLAEEFTNERLILQRADVTDSGDLAQLRNKVHSLDKKLVLWVNNAGLGLHQEAAGITEEQYNRIFDVNLKSTVFGSQTAHKIFSEQGSGGSIVNLSSVMGLTVLRLRSLYGTSKAAIIHLTKFLAEEWGEQGIRVNAIAPGFILTAMSHLSNASKEEIDESVAKIPLRRLGTTDDIAKIVLLLGSDLTSYQTGQVLTVDGGLTLTS